MKKAVVLLSGGLDSSTALAAARHAGFEVYALSFSYGQRHSVELEAAKAQAKAQGVAKHVIANIDLRAFGGSALTSDDLAVPQGRALDEMAHGIPVTYVPARNTVFLSFALAWAEVLGAQDVFLGINAVDYSGYPDCRPEYLEAFARMAKLATRAGVEGQSTLTFHAPLIDKTKAEIVALGVSLGVDFSLTSSCYSPGDDGGACGTCDSCQLRRKGFADAGVPDPTRYASRS